VHTVNRSTWSVAALLFGSGFCALVYQTAWLRQFRLIFGASTFATAAVLAIFMAGLGIGSALLGRRADRHPHPLSFYGNLELLIAAAAALSPLLLWLVAKVYFAIGGSVSLGLFFATLVRLLLSLVVLGLPTLLMGGTLPAAARAVETQDDEGRRKLALLYGANTLGAVLGTLVSTFYMLESLGNRGTLFVAVGINVVVGLAARFAGGIPGSVGELSPVGGQAPSPVPEAGEEERRGRPSAHRPELSSTQVLLAAGVVGFAFLLMELVWYRMLAPLLGGSTFTFGLILAVALLGIGLGGAAYSFGSTRRAATSAGFALTCALEALAIGIPFALGDRVAVAANLLRPLGAIGFHGNLIGWSLITFLVVFPAAFISGVQFPMLIALLGRGGKDVGDHVGRAYAWNTAGAIAGSLAGGFGLLPLLTAPGAWRFVVVLLALLAIAVMRRPTFAAILAALAIACTFALGPTTVWRHAGIGAGRAQRHESVNGTREWMNQMRRAQLWDVDGRESSVAVLNNADLAFIVNGKADGSARGDAGTQVMSGMIGAILHPNPKRALIIGLGTGSTAGWLGAVPSIDRVDVVELEPAVLRVARDCAAVNHDVLGNPKVHIRIADAREVLLATRDTYDIVFSEPSNPYRAGISSLFTEEFYRASAGRLGPGGIFLQWVQAYDVDAQTIRTIYATIGRVFPNVETWQTDSGDLLLAASREPIVYDADALRRRVAQTPYLQAMSHAWRVETLEGFLAHFVARTSLARAVAKNETDLNTDDRTLVEFGFARGLGEDSRFDMTELLALARSRGEDRPIVARGAVAWNLVASNRATTPYIKTLPPGTTEEDLARHRAALHYSEGRLTQALAEWRAHTWPPVNTAELVMLAESLADGGSDAALAYAEQLRPFQPADADFVIARLRYRQGRFDLSAAALQKAFATMQRNPWETVDAMGRSLDVARNLARIRQLTPAVIESLSHPFAAGQWEDVRKWYRAVVLKEYESCTPRTVHALLEMEPWPPWSRDFLTMRRDCYATVMLDSMRSRAQKDLDEFEAGERKPLLLQR
jgi:spermidine synthase/MFS family permease